MKVLVVVTSDARRGAQIEGCRLATELSSAGFAASAVALSPSGDSAPVDIESLGSSPLGATTFRELRRRGKLHDVVIAYGSTTLPACAIAFVGTGTPFVYRSIGDPGAWVREGWHRRRTGLLMRRAARVVALWPQAEQQITDLYGVPRERVTSISNARSPDEFRPATEQERKAARLRFGVPQTDQVAGIFGSLASEKRVGRAIEAVAQTNDWHLLIVGDGAERETVEAAAISRLGKRAVMAGPIDDMPEAYWAIDALLITSSTEGMPGVALESAMSGVPIVSTDVGAMSWLFEQGIPGSMVCEPIPSAIAQRLDGLVPCDDRRGSGARFQWAPVVDQWKRLIEDLA